MIKGYLLDTHVFLWLMLGCAHLKEAPVRTLASAAASGGLRVSPITCWEVAMLAARGRVHLGMPCQEWIAQSLSAPGLSVLDLSAQIAVEAAELPGQFHGDPADRILVACARVKNIALATRDAKILAYAQEGYLQVLPC
nr:type II toxin-antitoxin system VapC family toxin [Gloeobacter violaceus]